MFKKLLVAVLILASSSTVFAVTAPYIGGSIGLINNSSSNGNSNYRGFTGNVSLGYGGIIAPNFYLAAEVLGVPGSANISGNNTNRTTWGVGASVIPGLMLTDRTMGYARVGFIESNFTSDGNEKRSGGQLGVGLQTNICQSWDVRGEYVYTRYTQSINSDGVNFGLIYKFV